MNGKQLKNSILQWAIQGKLVPQDPNDEPASVLLDKIRQEKERLIKEKKIKRDKNASIIYRGEDNSYYEKLLATGEVKCIDEEVPFEIPQGWEWCRMGCIGDWGAGATPAKGNPDYYGGSILWLRTGELNNGIVYDSEIKITDKALQECSLRMNKIGDVLIAMYGATIGKVAIVGKELTTNQACCACTPFGIYNYYLFFFLMGSQIDFIKKGEGGAQPNISREKLISHLMPIPPLAEQYRIVEKIQYLLPLVEKYSNSQILQNKLNSEIKDKLRKSILQEAIQGKLVPQIAEEGAAQDLLEQIKTEKQKLVKEGKLKKSALNDSVIFRGDDNKYWEKKVTTCECIDEDIPFDVPESWAWVRLETILNTGSARRVHAKDWRQAGIPFYRAREIGKLADDGFVDNELYIDLSLYEDFSSSGVPLPNDLMITAVGTLGKMYIVKESDKFYYKDGSVLCLANKYGLCAEYLKMVIESPFFKGQYRQESQGTTVATLTMVRLQKYFIPIPPLQEQYRIVETYRNIASIMS